ncbi:hypothetical protein KR009_008635 [Drosophila setifemur]|nr:hypothetical protein KR009_008635 [Drosophila setifemur]
MNAAVCVVVTVPTEAEERTSCGSFCGYSLESKHHWDLCEEGIQRVGQRSASPSPRLPRSRALSLPGLKEDAPLEQLLRAIAVELRLEDVFWSQDVSGKQLQARFDLQQDEKYERLLCTLQEWGVGERPGTHVSALTCLETRGKSRGSPVQSHPTDPAAGEDQQQEQGWQSFMDSVRCRLNVNQVVRQVRRDATLTFDFVVLLMAAALLSCVGLVENSFLFLSSSMLISPLMGPIIAAIFGSVIGDRELRCLGLKNELLGIAVAVGIGFFFGGIVCGFGSFFAISSGLTEEIVSRCDTHSLAIGVCTALASGAAGAIAVLGGNTGSLVGVAISASLLPPAVNSGLLLALAIGAHLLPTEHALLGSLVKHRTYSADLSIQLLVCAAVSMALTLLNIVCVWLMGVVVLRIKEVAPAVQRHQQFWRHDVRTAREVAHLDPALQDVIDRLGEGQRELDVEAPHYQHTWSPGMERSQRFVGSPGSAKDQVNNYHTVHGFHECCYTLHRLKSMPKEAAPPSVMDLFPREEPSSGNSFSSCRSLPNISSLSKLCTCPSSSPARSISPESYILQHGSISGQDRGRRNVHWREEQLANSRESSLDGGPLKSHDISAITGQVLIPLPNLEQGPPPAPNNRPLILRSPGEELRVDMEPQDDEFQA